MNFAHTLHWTFLTPAEEWHVRLYNCRCNYSWITLLRCVMTQLCRSVAVMDMVGNCTNTAELTHQALGPLNSDQNVLILLNEVCALTASVTYKNLYKKLISLRFQWWCSSIYYLYVTLDCLFQLLSLLVFWLCSHGPWIVFECLNFSLFAILSFDTHIWMVASFRAAFLHLYDVGFTWHQLWSKICAFGQFHFHFFFCCWLPFFDTCKQLHLYVWISHFDFIFVKLDHQWSSSSLLSSSSSWLWNWVIDGHYGRVAGTRGRRPLVRANDLSHNGPSHHHHHHDIITMLMMMMDKMTIRGERIIRYSNSIRIVETE